MTYKRCIDVVEEDLKRERQSKIETGGEG